MVFTAEQRLDNEQALAAITPLVGRYDTRGARYTSYPPATEFNTAMDADVYAGYLRSVAGQNPGLPLSLYVHVPFCQDICYYCACNKIVSREAGIGARYVQSLVQEIALKASYGHYPQSVRQLHIGGGTPNFLNTQELMQLVHSLASHFNLSDSPDRDYAIEIDPRTVDNSQLALLAGVGFNRISMGIQDFDPQVQEAINRVQPYSLVERLVGELRDLGFRSINFDLIYGLPLQTEATVIETLEQVLTLRPDRIAVYNYGHMPHKFASQRALDRLPRPSAMEKISLQYLVRGALVAAGYINIGMDHYALPDDDLARALAEGRLRRNFQGYTAFDAQQTMGFGLSAISSHPDCYAQNLCTLDNYSAALDRGDLPLGKSFYLGKDDQIRREVIMSLCCQLRVNLSGLGYQFDINPDRYFARELEQIRRFEDDGLVDRKGHILEVTDMGRDFLRNICMVFDRYAIQGVAGDDDDAAVPLKFSRTM